MSRTSHNSIPCLFVGTAGRSASFPFESKIKPECWPNHWQSGIDGRRSGYWLLWVIFVEEIDQLF